MLNFTKQIFILFKKPSSILTLQRKVLRALFHSIPGSDTRVFRMAMDHGAASASSCVQAHESKWELKKERKGKVTQSGHGSTQIQIGVCKSCSGHPEIIPDAVECRAMLTPLCRSGLSN
jgi:hypothetical protein